jgi:hypothetical protein
MNFVEMRFFWIPISTMKCNEVPFTHIYEEKRRSPSSSSLGSPGWILVVATVEMGSMSMIRLPFFGFDSESETTSHSKAFISATND